MPVLPLIDLMILGAWSALIIGAAQKTLGIAIGRNLLIFGLSPMDFLAMAAVALLFAMSLAARQWVKANEPGILRRARRLHTSDEVLPDFPDPRDEDNGHREHRPAAAADRVPAS